MPAEKQRYTRLTRNASGLGVMSSLWLADDHLILVRSTGYTEDYSRFEMRDILGFFVTRSNRRLWWAVGWNAVALISGVFVVEAIANGTIRWAANILFGLAAIMLIGNYLLGPGCQLFIVTGVQTLPLPALVRLKKAHRVLDRLQPMILAAQSRLGVTSSGPPELPPALTSP